MSDERATSPVVGVAMLIAITVILVSVIGISVHGVGLGSAESPQVTLSFAVVGNTVEMTHEGGDRLVAGQIVVLDQDGTVRSGLQTDLVTGESAEIVANRQGVERITVVWRSPTSGTETVLATFKL